MIVKDEALVINWHGVSNTSRMVLWLTREHGLVATLIKGSLRPKSDFLGQYDLFYTCELLFYLRDQRDWFYTRECSPLELRTELRSRWRQCAAASYLAHLVQAVLPRNVPAPALFDLLRSSWDLLASGVPPAPLVVWTELQVLRDTGHQPVLHRCIECGLEYGEHFRGLYFDHERGGIVCERCRDPYARHEERLSPAVRALLERWLNETDPQRALRFHSSPQQIREIHHLMQHFIAWHLHLDPQARNTAVSWMERPGGNSDVA